MRFLAVVGTGWIGLRVAMLWPEGLPPERWVRIAFPGARAGPASPVPSLSMRAHARPVVPPAGVSARAPVAPVRPVAAAPDPDLVALALASPGDVGPVAGAAPLLSDRPLLPMPPMPPVQGPGITLSLWAMARPGAATGGPVQLGGGQAGFRLRVPVAGRGRLAAVVRGATPLAGQGREIAAGIEWRPVAPVALVVERRITIDRGGDGTGIGLIAGIERALPGGTAIEAYGQAGMVVRDGVEPYVDGAARMLHPVAAIGRGSIRLGIGGWGGAQRDAARVDIGPSAVAVVPVGGQAVRLSIDWRQRVAGNAAPGSGPAVTLGSDF